MKHLIFISVLLLIINAAAFSQQQEEETVVLALKRRAFFKELDSARQIIEDTVFETHAGFRIFPDIITIEINSVEYVVVRYPKFSKGGQQRSKNYQPNGIVAPAETYVDIRGKNDKILCMPKAVFDTIPKQSFYKLKQTFVAGQLTLPFKLRPKLKDQNFQMTTDVTIGAYAGLRQRIHRTKNYYLTVPATLGLTFINLNENSTSPNATTETTGVVPGWTWSSGLIGQFDNVNAGFVFGVDYASGVGNDWIYHKRLWFSFAIGFAFLQ